MVVAFPVAGEGAIYLDQHIRRGIVPKETIEKLMQFAVYLVENDQTDTSAADMVEQYREF